jgi:hypothetical protein
LCLPRSILDENESYLTTADSAIQVAEKALDKRISGGGNICYRAAFPVSKARGANFYPVDMDKKVPFRNYASLYICLFYLL